MTKALSHSTEAEITIIGIRLIQISLHKTFQPQGGINIWQP